MYTKGEWRIKRLPISKGIAICVGDELIAAGVDEANAQLIASAPDLYEACKEARDYLRFNKGNASPIYDKLDEALAKVEGKEYNFLKVDNSSITLDNRT